MLPLGLLKEILDFVKEGIAPSKCAACGRVGAWLCSSCSQSILFLKQQNCYRCGKLSPQGRTCGTCRQHTDLAGVTVAVYFDRGPVRSLIHEFKYGQLTELANVLSRMLSISARYNELGDFLVTSVPLHPNRLAKRGFNQAELLARGAATELGLSYRSLLARTKDTNSQVGLTREQRLGNIRDAFIPLQDIAKKKILLVDDVITTGATLEECAKTLKKAGANQVWALVVARG